MVRHVLCIYFTWDDHRRKLRGEEEHAPSMEIGKSPSTFNLFSPLCGQNRQKLDSMR